MQKRMVLFLIAGALVLAGCVSTPQPQPEPVTVIVATSPNWEYIQIGQVGSISENRFLIGNAILQWEDANPDRRIVSLQIDYQPSWYHGKEVFGLSIYSEVR